MISDDFEDDREDEGADLDDPEDIPKNRESLQDPVITRKHRKSTDSADQEDARDSDYSFDERDDEFENFINRTYVCEDCDFRWAEKIFPERNDFPDYDDEMGHAHICPMCGSMNVSFY